MLCGQRQQTELVHLGRRTRTLVPCVEEPVRRLVRSIYAAVCLTVHFHHRHSRMLCPVTLYHSLAGLASLLHRLYAASCIHDVTIAFCSRLADQLQLNGFCLTKRRFA